MKRKQTLSKGEREKEIGKCVVRALLEKKTHEGSRSRN